MVTWRDVNAPIWEPARCLSEEARERTLLFRSECHGSLNIGPGYVDPKATHAARRLDETVPSTHGVEGAAATLGAGTACVCRLKGTAAEPVSSQ